MAWNRPCGLRNEVDACVPFVRSVPVGPDLAIEACARLVAQKQMSSSK